MTTYLTENEIHVMGIIRTGQHAIISWVVGHFDKVCFKNGMTIKQSKYATYIGPPWWYFNLEERPNFVWEVDKNKTIRPEQNAVILGTEFMRNTKLQMTPNLEYLDKIAHKAGYDEFSNNKRYMAVIRSPHNHFASVMRFKKGGWLTDPNKFKERWKMMARECVGITDNLPHPKIFVNYDRWFTDIEYRKGLSEKMGIPFSDRGLNVVMKVGVRHQVGSSFDQMSYQGDAQKMGVTDRWKEYQDDPRFKAVFKDEELRELSEQIFGRLPF